MIDLHGETVSHYKIFEKIGAGGMGVVYRAKDIRLGREVAIKFLPQAKIAGDPQSLRRFEREARAVALINHPHICTLFDVGEHQESPFLVMEFLKGRTLNERIDEGPLSIDEVLDLGVQIADALEAAHAEGLVHRDVKPSNLFLTRRGHVKVLDFGLVRRTDQIDDDGSKDLDLTATGAIDTLSNGDLTQTGAALGTVAYMSPEQALGKKLDERTDIFSLGIVLYEMAAGEPAFGRGSFGAVLDGILNQEAVAPSQHRDELPEELDEIILRCLEKNLDHRYSSVEELSKDLRRLRMERSAQITRGMIEETVPLKVRTRPIEEISPPPASWKFAGLQGLGLGIGLSLGLMLLWILYSGLSSDPEEIAAPRVAPLTTDGGYKANPQLSPDGFRVAYSRGSGGFAFNNSSGLYAGDIYVKSIGIGAAPLRLTDHPDPETNPVWSPDGQELAFLRFSSSGRTLFLISATGGSERALIDLKGPPSLFGHLDSLSWSGDGWMYFTEIEKEGGPAIVRRLSPETLEKQTLTSPPASSMGDFSPAVSPDGSLLAFARSGSKSWGNHDLWIQPIAGGEPRRLTFEHYSFCRSLFWSSSGDEIFFTDPGESIFRVDLQGNVRPVLGVGRHAADASIRGDKMIYRQEFPRNYDVHRLSLSRSGWEPDGLLVSSADDNNPSWSPDGQRIAFESNRSGVFNIWISRSDGSRAYQATHHTRHAGTPRWSPDGRQLVYDSLEAGNWDLYLVAPDGGTSRRLTDEPSEEGTGSWSRDGRWIYHHSDRGGSIEIWKIDSETGELVQVTQNGGFYGEESWDGRYLYYSKSWGDDGLWRVDVDGGNEVEIIPEIIDWSEWTSSPDGIYFTENRVRQGSTEYVIRFFDFATESIREIHRQEGEQDHQWLSISPDEKFLLFSRRSYRQSEIILVEGFR